MRRSIFAAFIVGLVLGTALPAAENLPQDNVPMTGVATEDGTNSAALKRWARLRNGDRLTFRFASDSLPVMAEGTTRSIPTGKIRTIRFDDDKPQLVTVTLSDGTELRGSLSGSEISLQLEAGPKLNLPLRALAFVGDSEGAVIVAGILPGPGSITSSNAPPGFVWVDAGEFLMGSPPEELGRDLDEGPQTKVVIPQGFWMSKYEVTQAEYQRVMGNNPSLNPGDATRPVEKVTWYEAMDYCARLTRSSHQMGLLATNFVCRLPTEAEWEFACRAGAASRFSYGEDKNEVDFPRYAWFTRNSESMTHPVGKKERNRWGLFDMHGNVWEWCLDRWEGGLPGGSVTNRPVEARGTLRAARGGSWLYEARACRSANRDDYSASNRCGDLGFRLVIALEPVK